MARGIVRLLFGVFPHVLAVVVWMAPGTARAQLITPLNLSFQNSIGIAYRAGVVYVANGQSDSIVQVSSAGAVTPFAAGLHSQQALAFDANGILYAGNGADGTISTITPDGVVSRFVGGFARPQALAFDSAGVLYVADQITGTISKVTTAGKVSVFATGFGMPSAIAFDPAGVLWVADALNGSVSKVSTSGAVTLFGNKFSEPDGLVFDTHGTLFIAELEIGQISRVAAGASTSTVFVASSALKNAPQGLSLGMGNSIYVAGLNNAISQITAKGVVTRLAPKLNLPTAVAADATGNLFVFNSGDGSVVKLQAGGGPLSTVATGLPTYADTGYPTQFIAIDLQGNIYVSDGVVGNVTKITPSKVKTVFATVQGASGLAFDTAGNLFVGGSAAAPGTGAVTKVTPAGQASELATFPSFKPYALTFDKSGVLYVALYYNTAQSAIATISPDGVMTQSVLRVTQPVSGMAFDQDGSLDISSNVSTVTPYLAGLYRISVKGMLSTITNAIGGYQIGTDYSPYPLPSGFSIDQNYRLIATNPSTNLLETVDTTLPPSPPPSYSATKADLASGYFLGFRSAPLYGSGSINLNASTCSATQGNVFTAVTNCGNRGFGPGEEGGYFRADIGLTSSGVPAPNGNGNSVFRVAAIEQIPKPGAAILVNQVLNNIVFPPPTSANQTRMTAAGKAFALDLTAGSTGFPLSYTILGTPTGGTLSGLNPAFVTFTPNAGFTGIANYSFVDTSYQGSSTQAQGFVAVGVPFPARPVVGTLSLQVGTAAGGQTVIISGANLTGPAAVRFGLNPASITAQTATAITVTSPAGTAGSTVDVTVFTAGGGSTTGAADLFTYQ